MRFGLATALMFAIFALDGPARAQRTDMTIPAVDAIFAPWDEAGSPGCALGVVEDGEFIYERGYGFATLAWGIPSAPDTVFYVG